MNKKQNKNEEIMKQQEKINDIKKKMRKEKEKLRELKKHENKKIFFDRVKDIKNETYNFKEVLTIKFFSLALGIISCISMFVLLSGGKNYLRLNKDLQKFIDAYYAITDNYYGDLDKETLIEDAIEGMVSSVGDVYTGYTDSNDTTTFLETVNGQYEGIGCTIAIDGNGNIVVVDMFEDSPSAKAGLQIDDRILKIDEIDTKEKTTTELSDYIKNSSEKSITMVVLRDEKEIKLTIERSIIEIPSVAGEVIEKDGHKVGYMNISVFSSVTDKQFKEVIDKLQKDNIESLIIDVRSNGGGYLSTVTDVVNRILEKDEIIYQLEGKNDKTEKKKDTTKEHLNIPIAILTNGASASASEILAAAIKESYGGYVVGTNTYGKGTVQQTATLSDGSMVKYTTQKWLTPDGNWIEEVGLTPTHIVELSEDYYSDPSRENDNQFQKALELLINGEKE